MLVTKTRTYTLPETTSPVSLQTNVALPYLVIYNNLLSTKTTETNFAKDKLAHCLQF